MTILLVQWLQYMPVKWQARGNFWNIRKIWNISAFQLRISRNKLFSLCTRLLKSKSNNEIVENLIKNKCMIDYCNWKWFATVAMDFAKVSNFEIISNIHLIIQVQWMHVTNWWAWKHFCMAKKFSLYKLHRNKKNDSFFIFTSLDTGIWLSNQRQSEVTVQILIFYSVFNVMKYHIQISLKLIIAAFVRWRICPFAQLVFEFTDALNRSQISLVFFVDQNLEI